MTAAAHPKSPPKARLAFRVGIVGHRPNRLPQNAAAQNELRDALAFILAQTRSQVDVYAGTRLGRQWYAHEKPLMRAVSSLAEGCDRIFAEAAIAQGYQILCPMPFHQPEFEKDFAPGKALEPLSLQRFRALLESADHGGGLVKFELGGERARESQAYAAAGRVVLNQSDLLIAVWDGGPGAGGGGTADSIRQAIQFHVPVIWIDPFSPQRWQALRSADDLKCLRDEICCRPEMAGYASTEESRADLIDALKDIVHGQIARPDDHEAARYFCQRKPAINPGGLSWKLFRTIVGFEPPRRPFIAVRDFIAQIRPEWPVASDPALAQAPSKAEDWVNRELRPHFAWADKLGGIYGDKYRSTYINIYFLSLLTVALALLPLCFGLPEGAYAAAELVILLYILVSFWRAQLSKRHERWMEYRLLAELIRQSRLLIPLGGGYPFPNLPVVSTAWGSPTQTWMYWHMRGISRAVGLPSAKVTPDYLRQCLEFLKTVTSGQLLFHSATAHRSGRIARLLHVMSIALFVLTIAVVGLHLASSHTATPAGRNLLIFLSAVLPGIGAAFFAILNQGEFVRLNKRSAAMADLFHKFSIEIAVLQSDRVEAGLSDAAALARKIANAMVDEVADWRVVFADRHVTIS